jgi:hypothetical protein
MSTPSASSDDRNAWIYWAVAVVVGILLVVGLVTYSGKKNDEQAQAKAQQVTQKLQAAGLPVPKDQDVLVRSLGTDGGNVCDNPGKSLGKALLYDSLSNGASFVGHRPVIVDRRVVAGEALILQTYCPDKLQDFKQKIQDKLKFDDVLKS